MPTAKCTIAAGGTTSNAIAIDGYALPVGLIIPALTTSTAVTFTVSDALAGTYVILYNSSGTQVSVTASTSAARAVALDPALFAAWSYLKCVVADAQGANREITVKMK